MKLLWTGLGWIALLLFGAIFVLLHLLPPGPSELFRVAASFILGALALWIAGPSLQSGPSGSGAVRPGERPAPTSTLFGIPLSALVPYLLFSGIILFLADWKLRRVAADRAEAAPSTPAVVRPQRIRGGSLPYTVLAPEGWTLQRNRNSYDLVLASAGGSCSLGVHAANTPRGETSQLLELVKRDVESSSGYVLTAGTATDIDGHSWQMLEGVEDVKGQRFLCRIYACVLEDSAYIMMAAFSEHADPRATEQLRQIVASFRFPPAPAR